jgi:hypothetical protein
MSTRVYVYRASQAMFAYGSCKTDGILQKYGTGNVFVFLYFLISISLKKQYSGISMRVFLCSEHVADPDPPGFIPVLYVDYTFLDRTK